MKRFLVLPAVLLLAACAAAPSGFAPAAPAPSSSASSIAASSALPTAEAYVMELAQTLVSQLSGGRLTQVETVAALYRYLVEHIYFAEPPAPDLWRWRCAPEPPPSYLDQRALGPLAYRIGSCEDFAAAMTVLLRAAGFEAEYVSGLTVSAKREWVDHAWTVVRLGRDWYHLDSQLEQNVLKDGRLSFRYFLRDDEWMLADHLWGEWLAAYWGGRLAPEQRAKLLDEMTPPRCTGAPPARPEPLTVEMNLPDVKETVRMLHEERDAWEREHGPLPARPVNWEPPIFSIMPRAGV